MKKIVDYGFISANSLEKLAETVKEEINNGWSPLGGVTFLGYIKEIPNYNGFGLSAVARNLEEIDHPFIQTMVRYENK